VPSMYIFAFVIRFTDISIAMASLRLYGCYEFVTERV
jgi:hypothetical protein